jgi:hypothetical protein
VLAPDERGIEVRIHQATDEAADLAIGDRVPTTQGIAIA